MITPLPANKQRPGREQRAWPRAARHIRVLLLPEDSALDEPYGGWIVDTSRGGVCLRLGGDAFPVGSLVMIRGPFASARVPWTAVRVRHSRKTSTGWELGCAFVAGNCGDTTQLNAATLIDRRLSEAG